MSFMKEGEGGISKLFFVEKATVEVWLFPHLSDNALELKLVDAVKKEDYKYAELLKKELELRKKWPCSASPNIAQMAKELVIATLPEPEYHYCPLCNAKNCMNNDSCITCNHPFL